MILLTFYIYVSGMALMQENCDIIGLLCNGVRSGPYAGRLCYNWPFMLWCQEWLLCRKVVILLAFYVIVSGVALMQVGCDIIDLLCLGVRSGSYAGRL